MRGIREKVAEGKTETKEEMKERGRTEKNQQSHKELENEDGKIEKQRRENGE